MKNLIDFTKAKVSILGAARSGISCAKLLTKHGAHVFLSDSASITEQLKTELNTLGISFEEDHHSNDKILDESDFIVTSPGIPLNQKLLLEAKLRHIPILSEIEVASWFFSPHIIPLGITGTNGKSTTTNYLDQLIHLKKDSVACGNIGKPVCDVLLERLEKIPEGESLYLSMELSSYQLETIYSLNPYCTCFLNIQNDHQSRYENIEEYFKAKWRLILQTQDDGIAILEMNVFLFAIRLGLSLPKCKIIVYSSKETQHPPHPLPHKSKNNKLNTFLKKKIDCGANLPIALYKELKELPLHAISNHANIHFVSLNYFKENNSAKINFLKYNWNIENLCLNGSHNLENIFVASMIAEHIGLTREIILLQMDAKTSQYVHLPHRLEIVGNSKIPFQDKSGAKKKVEIINDSKATNVESTLVAIASFHSPIRLLLGGEPKGDSYFPILELCKTHPIYVYPFGKAASQICEAFQKFPQALKPRSSKMLDAANLALCDSIDNDIILLSPACSSFDEFKDFEHRGNVFREWVISCQKEKENE